MIPGLLGKKIGMTQIFEEDGRRVSVTLLEAGPCQVQAVKIMERDGYSAVQLGYDDTKEKNLKKPQREHLKSNNLKPKKMVREIRCPEKVEVKIGKNLTSEIFQKGDFLDITGISKGKGFQGGMKRCGWRGGVETHGSMSHRAPGSIGASSFPSRVTKGHGMPGHMGVERVTVQNIEVLDVNSENNTIVVKGSVPGANGSYLVMSFAGKKPVAKREEKVKEGSKDEAENAKESGGKKEESA